MITVDEFVKKWTGKPCEMGGSANAMNQCVDLANAYIAECLGLPIILWTNAQDFPSKAGDKYEYIENTPTGVPNKGDIIIWKSKDNVGHIAIFLDGTASKFNSFDQNWPTGSTCHIQSHTYTTTYGTDVIGWLRAKPATTMYKGLDLTNQESMKVAVDALTDLQNGDLVRKAQVDQITKDLNQKLVDQATAYEREKAIKDEQIHALEDSLKQLQDTEHTWADQCDAYQRKLKAMLEEFMQADIQMAAEMDEDILVNTVHKYITDAEADRRFIIKVTTDSSLKTPEAVIEALETAKTTKETINTLNETIVKLKAKNTVLRTINLPGIIIKIYRA